MPVYKIRIDRELYLNGEVKIWAPNKEYIQENRDEIIGIGADYMDFEENDHDDSIGSVTETPESRDKVIDEELVFGFVPEEHDAEEEAAIVLPGQLKLLET